MSETGYEKLTYVDENRVVALSFPESLLISLLLVELSYLKTTLF